MIKKSPKHLTTVGDWQVNIEENMLISSENKVVLLPKVMKALEFFIQNPAQTLTFDQLNEAIWPNEVVGDNSIYNLIGQLRKSLGDTPTKPRYIETISKKGYRLIAQVQNTALQKKVETNKNETGRQNTLSKLPVRTMSIIAAIFITLALIFTIQNQSIVTQQANKTSNHDDLPVIAQQFYALAMYHQQKSDYESKLLAVDNFKKALAIAPNQTNIYQELAFTNIALMTLVPFEKNLFFQKAQLAAETASKLDKNDVTNQFLRLLLKKESLGNADKETLSLFLNTQDQKDTPLSNSTRLAYADFQFKQGNISQSIEQLKKVTEQCESCPVAYRKLANAYMVNLDIETAQKYYQKYHLLNSYDENDPIKISSQGALTFETLSLMSDWHKQAERKALLPFQKNHLCIFYLNSGQFEKAYKLASTIEKSPPSDFFTLYTLAAVASAKKDVIQSHHYLTKRHQLFPNNALFSHSLAISHLILGEPEKAMQLLASKVLIANNENQPKTWLLQSALLTANGNKEQANKLLQTVKNTISGQATKSLNGLMDLAYVYALMNQPTLALDNFEKAINNGWVADFNLNWWRIEDDPFFASLKKSDRFNKLVSLYYQNLASITD